MNSHSTGQGRTYLWRENEVWTENTINQKKDRCQNIRKTDRKAQPWAKGPEGVWLDHRSKESALQQDLQPHHLWMFYNRTRLTHSIFCRSSSSLATYQIYHWMGCYLFLTSLSNANHFSGRQFFHLVLPFRLGQPRKYPSLGRHPEQPDQPICQFQSFRFHFRYRWHGRNPRCLL